MSPELVGVIVGGSIGLASSALGQLFSWFQLKSSRAFDLRQAVYVEAAAAMAKGLEFFSNVVDLSLEDSQIPAAIHPTSVAMYKIHVVGTPATIAALSGANQELTVAAMDLMKRRTLLRAAIQPVSPASEDRSEVEELHREFINEAMRASLRYQRHLVEVNISARRELGLPLDEQQYRAANLEAEQRILSAFDRTMGELRQPNPQMEPTRR